MLNNRTRITKASAKYFRLELISRDRSVIDSTGQWFIARGLALPNKTVFQDLGWFPSRPLFELLDKPDLKYVNVPEILRDAHRPHLLSAEAIEYLAVLRAFFVASGMKRDIEKTIEGMLEGKSDTDLDRELEDPDDLDDWDDTLKDIDLIWSNLLKFN